MLTNENTQFESHNKHIINNKKSPSNIIQKYKNTPITKHGRNKSSSFIPERRNRIEPNRKSNTTCHYVAWWMERDLPSTNTIHASKRRWMDCSPQKPKNWFLYKRQRLHKGTKRSFRGKQTPYWSSKRVNTITKHKQRWPKSSSERAQYTSIKIRRRNDVTSHI